MSTPLTPGDRVEVNWGSKDGWLPGTFQGYCPGDVDENFDRVVVKMDNGWACHGGYHPDCVRLATMADEDGPAGAPRG